MPDTDRRPVVGRPAPATGRHARSPGTAGAETWPGPAIPVRWLLTLAVLGAVLGGLVGALIGALGSEQVTVSATVQIRPDAEALSGPLDTIATPTTGDNFLASELAWLDAEAAQRGEELGSDVALTVSQVGTADVLRISATAPSADDAQQATTGLLDAYVDRRQTAAGDALQTALDQVESRLNEIGFVVPTSPQSREYERLLASQSDLQSALTRVPSIAPVLRAPAVEAGSGASSLTLDVVLGIVVGIVLAFAGAAAWRAASPRLFDARLLVAAGVDVLLPRLPAGHIRGRRATLPEAPPTPKSVRAAGLLLPQVLGRAEDIGALLVVGADERAGAAEVTWALAWALAGYDSGVTVVSTAPVAEERVGEREVAPALTVVGMPGDGGAAALGAVVREHRAAGRRVLVHAPTLSGGIGAHHLGELADHSVLVVGEGVSTLEAALAAVRDVGGTDLAGVVVTTLDRATGRKPRPTPARTEA